MDGKILSMDKSVIHGKYGGYLFYLWMSSMDEKEKINTIDDPHGRSLYSQR